MMRFTLLLSLFLFSCADKEQKVEVVKPPPDYGVYKEKIESDFKHFLEEAKKNAGKKE